MFEERFGDERKGIERESHGSYEKLHALEDISTTNHPNEIKSLGFSFLHLENKPTSFSLRVILKGS